MTSPYSALQGLPGFGGTPAALTGMPGFSPQQVQQPGGPVGLPKALQGQTLEQYDAANPVSRVGALETAATQFGRGALDTLLASGSLLGAALEGTGSLADLEGLEDFGRDLGQSSSGAAAAEAAAFLFGTAAGSKQVGLSYAERADHAIREQEQAWPLLTAVSRIGGGVALGLGAGALAGGVQAGAAGTLRGLSSIGAYEGAAGGVQAAYERNEAFRDIVVSGLTGAAFGAAGGAAVHGIGAIPGKIGAAIDERNAIKAIFGDIKTAADDVADEIRKAGGKEVYDAAKTILKERAQVLKDVAAAGENPSLMRLAYDKATRAAGERISTLAGDFDPGSWATKAPSTMQKLLHRTPLLDRVSDDLAQDVAGMAAARPALDFDLKVPGKLLKDADKTAAIGGLQSRLTQAIEQMPDPRLRSELLEASALLSKANAEDSMRIAHELANKLARISREKAIPGRAAGGFGSGGKQDGTPFYRIQRADDHPESLLNPKRKDGWVADEETFVTQPHGISVTGDVEDLYHYAQHYSMAPQKGDRLLRVFGYHAGDDADQYAQRALVEGWEDLGDAQQFLALARKADREAASDTEMPGALEAILQTIRPVLAGGPVDEVTASYALRTARGLADELSSDAWGSAGKAYRSLSQPSQLSQIDAKALREGLRHADSSRTIPDLVKEEAELLTAAYAARKQLGGEYMDDAVKGLLKDSAARAEKAHAAVTFDGAPARRVLDVLTGAGRNIGESYASDLLGMGVGAAIGGVPGMLVARALAPVLGDVASAAFGKSIAGAGQKAGRKFAATAVEAIKHGAKDSARRGVTWQQHNYNDTVKKLSDMVTGGGGMAGSRDAALAALPAEIQLHASGDMQTRVSQLLADLPKPHPDIRGEEFESLSYQDLLKSQAMTEATMDPMSVFSDFAGGSINYDKAQYAWKQYPGLQQAAQAGLMDIIHTQFSKDERKGITDGMLTQLDSLLGFGGELQPTSAHAFAMRMEQLMAPAPQNPPPSPGGKLNTPLSQPSFTERLSGQRG